MQRTILVLLLCIPSLAWGAKPPEGRWEGPVEIPGRDLQLVVDLAQDSAGAWKGSIIVSGLGLKGEPLTNVVVTDADVAFEVGSSFRSATHGPARFKAHLLSADRMAGDMTQGGNVAKFSLARVASAQVEMPVPSTRVTRDIEDRWTGDFELGGYPRHVTITFENHADAPATAQFVIVGKQTTTLPVDLVIQEDNLVRIESQERRVTFEGRFVKESGEIRGIVELLSLELPLVLHRVRAS